MNFEANDVIGVFIVGICRIPDNHIDPRRYPLLVARSIMRGVIDELKAGRERC